MVLATTILSLALPLTVATTRAATDPCASSKTKLACLASLPTLAQVGDQIRLGHALVKLPTTNPTLAYLSNSVTGANSFFMPTGRCNQVAHQSDGSPASIADCTFGNAKAGSANTIVLTGDSRAVMWATAYAKLATVLGWRLVVLAKPGCVAQTGELTYLNVPNRPGPWVACNRFRTAVMSDLAVLKPAMVVVASNPAASLADGRRTSQNGTLAHANSLAYLQLLKSASPNASFVFLSGFPLLVNTSPGVANPVACLAAHKQDIRFCDVRSNNSVNDDPTNRAVTQSAVDANFAVIDQKPWLCSPTCPGVINKMIPYSRDGLHINNTYSGWLMGVMWRSLAGVPNSPVQLPTN
ncbi:unannotated protein [freshwater metagenome]|uniref:Unannotated protein n=1 Tax=freshwater metagenome TaxID=449393 RepID=A0A6J7DDC2_9ZZZZ